MTALLVAQLDLDHFPPNTTLQDVLDVSSVTTKNWKRSDVWISLFSVRKAPHTLGRICGELGVDQDKVLLSSKSVNAQEGSKLLGEAIAYSNAYATLVLYDCNEDATLAEVDFAKKNVSEGSAFARFGLLDSAHRSVDLATMAKQLEALVETSQSASSSAGETLRFLARPLARYIRTYRAVLLALAPEQSLGAQTGEYDALNRFVFTSEMARLIHLEAELQGELSELDFVRASIDFFRFGANSMGALGKLHGHTLREALCATLGWWTSYYMSAAKEFTSLGLNSTALLYFCRAFETYVLAYLWRSGGVELDSSSKGFVLKSGKEPGLASLWDAIRTEAPEFTKRFHARFHRARLYRNANLLVHGFSVPDADSLSKVKSFVEDMIREWDGRLSRESRIIRGRIKPFFRGLASTGGLGRKLATAIVARSQARI